MDFSLTTTYLTKNKNRTPSKAYLISAEKQAEKLFGFDKPYKQQKNIGEVKK